MYTCSLVPSLFTFTVFSKRGSPTSTHTKTHPHTHTHINTCILTICRDSSPNSSCTHSILMLQLQVDKPYTICRLNLEDSFRILCQKVYILSLLKYKLSLSAYFIYFIFARYFIYSDVN